MGYCRLAHHFLPIDNVDSRGEMPESCLDAFALERIDALRVAAIELHLSDSSRYILDEISRFGVGHRDICLLGVVSHRPLELSASFKHVFRVQALPRLFRNDAGEFLAATEHVNHLLDFLHIETPQVE